MWAGVTQILWRGRIQHRRIHGAAGWMLLVRLLEGAASWVVLHWFFGRITVPAWAVHLNFAAYGLANIALFFPQRREALTPGLVWVDILANLLPMAVAAHWSGGAYSPLLPIFVLKIGNYGLIYGVDIGVQSLVAALLMAIGLAVIELAGLVPAQSIDSVPLLVRQRLTLSVAGLIFLIGVLGSFRFFQLLSEREARLTEVSQEMNRLYQESLRHQQHLRRLSRHMIQASERTMRMLVRELHDDLGQALTAVRIDLSLIDRQLPPDSPIRAHVEEARGQIGAVLQGVRHLSSLLRPAVLDDLGLIAAMQSYIDRFAERTGIRVRVESPPPETRLPPPIELALYRVLQEALTNVARHAHARNVHVSLQTNREQVRLQIADDGQGFDAATFLENPRPTDGMGLIGMRERVATYGGRFAIHSRPEAGTQVELSISLTQPIPDLEDADAEDPRPVG